MPLLQDVHDHLPYIDTDISPDEYAHIQKQLSHSLPSDHLETLHPSIIDSFTPRFSPLIDSSHESIAQTGKASESGSGIDMSRYEEEPPAPTDASDDQAWTHIMNSTHISQQYLSGRETNLGLLEKYGRNAWLISNSQTEDILRALEKELKDARDEVDKTEEERRTRQEAVRGEIAGLESTWRDGLGRAIEAEVAGEGLRQKILELQRQRASNPRRHES